MLSAGRNVGAAVRSPIPEPVGEPGVEWSKPARVPKPLPRPPWVDPPPPLQFRPPAAVATGLLTKRILEALPAFMISLFVVDGIDRVRKLIIGPEPELEENPHEHISTVFNPQMEWRVGRPEDAYFRVYAEGDSPAPPPDPAPASAPDPASTPASTPAPAVEPATESPPEAAPSEAPAAVPTEEEIRRQLSDAVKPEDFELFLDSISKLTPKQLVEFAVRWSKMFSLLYAELVRDLVKAKALEQPQVLQAVAAKVKDILERFDKIGRKLVELSKSIPASVADKDKYTLVVGCLFAACVQVYSGALTILESWARGSFKHIEDAVEALFQGSKLRNITLPGGRSVLVKPNVRELADRVVNDLFSRGTIAHWEDDVLVIDSQMPADTPQIATKFPLDPEADISLKTALRALNWKNMPRISGDGPNVIRIKFDGVYLRR